MITNPEHSEARATTKKDLLPQLLTKTRILLAIGVLSFAPAHSAFSSNADHQQSAAESIYMPSVVRAYQPESPLDPEPPVPQPESPLPSKFIPNVQIGQ